MSLAKGTRLGPYELLSLVGAGGMGEVYKATDTRLNRTVAIKVLPAHFSESAEMKQRFDREARAVASLNHPQICVLHDIGRHEGIDYLVMEYLEGETLARRIERGAAPLAETLQISVQIADALDKAHRQGVTHRDLKPANVMLTKSGCKLLDFGLAKLRTSEAVASTSEAPTRMTVPGILLGTLPYMAPEQLEGREADERTDIFAFGAVLYETATGRKPFSGESQAALISEIMKTDPRPITVLQPTMPAALDHVVKRCLAKDPEDRWQSARDVMGELQWIKHEGAPPGPGTVRRKTERIAWALLALAMLTLVATATALVSVRQRVELVETRFLLSTPTGPDVADMAVSPDGRSIAFVASTAEGGSALFIRPRSSVSSRQLAGTQGAIQPFWSPDSRSIAFISSNRIKRLDVSGGAPQEVSDVSTAGQSGGTWGRDGTVVFAPGVTGGSVLFAIPPSGGSATAVTALDSSQQETGHFWPHFLPDGRHFLYLAWSTVSANRTIYVGSLDSDERTRLLTAESMAVYAAPGYLVFRRGGTLLAQPFDADGLKLTGDAVPVADQVAGGVNGRGAFSVSQNGVLLYRAAGTAANRQFVWFDRKGSRLETVGTPDLYTNNFDLSPDGKQIAVARLNPATSQYDVWLIDWKRGVPTRFTFDPALSQFGNVVWSPDGLRIALTSERTGNRDVFTKPIAGGDETTVLNSVADEWVEDWSKDGRYILYGTNNPGGGGDLFALPTLGDRKPVPVAQSPFTDDEPRFSFDGKWVAYNSVESGTHQVYLTSFPRLDQRRQVTSDGGAQPHWREDGRELYYLDLQGRLMAVDITPGSTIDSGTPHVLFDTRLTVDPIRDQFAVTSDGQRFLFQLPVAEPTPTPITVVLDWAAAFPN